MAWGVGWKRSVVYGVIVVRTLGLLMVHEWNDKKPLFKGFLSFVRRYLGHLLTKQSDLTRAIQRRFQCCPRATQENPPRLTKI
ncbi:hypothetical protein FHX57_007118 [Paraburkholderia tropica]|uniref:hypothetical protein n=1 Tax=Paraburkholderia tropica TaxID=92647 RepID=UPI0011B7A3FC|nr:hypothetical protein [Paraburkholderia tropica]MBB3004734.1 hypothetical protein [Paraburkholderia tropica]MBB6323531.1 hypothetical protein [Paraburkholderia tropica]QNB17422.1 hypothetical protein G5S35_38165 [Paraburkholderia tropica]